MDNRRSRRGRLRQAWRNYAHFDTFASLLERIGVGRLVWAGVVTGGWTVFGWLRSIDPYWLGVVALFVFGGFVWAWNQVTAWRRARYATMDERLLAEQSEAPRALAEPDSAAHKHIAGEMKAVEAAPDTFRATGTLGLAGLYVGNIIAAAGHLESEHRLELAIVGFNGSGETIAISEIDGHIKGGTGGNEDKDDLSIPALRKAVTVEPLQEFRVILNQHVTPAQAERYLSALTQGNVSLELRQLTIKAACRGNPERWVALPLWDGVILRRRDDIVSNRVHMLEAQALLAGAATMTATATVTKGSKKPNAED